MELKSFTTTTTTITITSLCFSQTNSHKIRLNLCVKFHNSVHTAGMKQFR